MELNVQSKKEIWKRRLAESYQHRGGISAYCRDNGLSIATFNYWRKKFQTQHLPKALTPFAAVRMETALKVDELPDPKWLASFAAELIRGLR